MSQSSLGIYRATASDLKIKMLVYGDPGSGKTTLALTANDHPSLAPALVLNFEGGLLSVVNRGDVDAVDIHSLDDLERLFWFFRESHESVNQYKTVIVDSGSELYNLALRETVNYNLAKQRNRKGDEDDYEISDYGRAGNIVFRLFSMFRDLPLHVIVTSHAKYVFPPNADPQANPNLEPREVRPSFSLSLAGRLMGIFDAVHYLYSFDQDEPTGVEDEEGKPIMHPVTHRGLLTRSLGAYRAKTRGPNFAYALGDTVLDPTMPMLYNTLLATEGEGVNGLSPNAALQDREQDQVEDSEVGPIMGDPYFDLTREETLSIDRHVAEQPKEQAEEPEKVEVTV